MVVTKRKDITKKSILIYITFVAVVDSNRIIERH